MNAFAIYDWAKRHNISPQAMHELRVAMVPDSPIPRGDGVRDEGWVQSTVRLRAARAGHLLFRNNVGALRAEDGRTVRFGLGNDSAKVNDVIKSADLIGGYRVLIGPQHVGHTFLQFWSLEVKRPDWRYAGTPREVAQQNWATLIVANGGRASFTTGEQPL